MKLSTKCRYGTRAIVEIAKNYQKCPTKRKDIAAAQELNDSYLENILITLRDRNIIGTLRGAKGGFVLRKHPADISVLEIVEALQGTLELVDCLTDPALCHRSKKCITRPIWKKLQDAQRDVLQGITIQSLVDQESH